MAQKRIALSPSRLNIAVQNESSTQGYIQHTPNHQMHVTPSNITSVVYPPPPSFQNQQNNLSGYQGFINGRV